MKCNDIFFSIVYIFLIWIAIKAFKHTFLDNDKN